MSDDEPKRPPHPLDGVDDWDCYDQHIGERNTLISAKREAEDGFVKTIIQLSSAIVLAVPGIFALDVFSTIRLSGGLITGIFLVALSLVAAVSEQFLSSIAYEKQIDKTDAYYTKRISDRSPPPVSRYVKFCLLASFIAFVLGVLVTSAALTAQSWRTPMAQSPRPPSPPPPPSQPPTPKHDSGRSVPPTPPPSPPSSPRR